MNDESSQPEIPLGLISRRAMVRGATMVTGAAITGMATMGVDEATASALATDKSGAVVKLGKFYRQNGDATMIDVTKNPGFGIRAATSEDRILRNLRIAQWYYHGLGDARKNGWAYFISDGAAGFPCRAPDATTMIPAYVQVPRDPTKRSFGSKPSSDPATAAYREVNFVQREVWAFLNALPDFGMVPESFLARPFDGGVIFSLEMMGTSKKTGQSHRMWEDNTFLINEDGLITHWECVSDTAGMNAWYKEVYGQDVTEIDFGSFVELVDLTLVRQGGAPPFMHWKRPGS